MFCYAVSPLSQTVVLELYVLMLLQQDCFVATASRNDSVIVLSSRAKRGDLVFWTLLDRNIIYWEENMLIRAKKIPVPHPGAAAVLLLTGLLFISPLTPCPAAEEDPSFRATTLETITVTAQKREEDVQKVTTSITVLSDMEIEDAHIESTRDIWRYVPNLTASHGGSRDYWSRIKVRGISNTAFGDPGWRYISMTYPMPVCMPLIPPCLILKGSKC